MDKIFQTQSTKLKLNPKLNAFELKIIKFITESKQGIIKT